MYRFNVGRFNRLLARAAEANSNLDLITATRALALAVKMLPLRQRTVIIDAACDLPENDGSFHSGWFWGGAIHD